MKAILVEQNGYQCVDIEDSLQSFYEALSCDVIDIVRRNIGGRLYDIICDDEGLLKDRPIVSAINSACDACLVGKLLICDASDSENMIGISDEGIEHLHPYMAWYLNPDTMEFSTVVTHCDYC